MMKSITVPYRITRRIQTAMSYQPSAISLLEECKGYGGGNCVKNFQITVRGKCIICPNSAAARVVERIASYLISIFYDCPTTITSSTPPTYVLPGGTAIYILPTSGQGGGGGLPGTNYSPIQTSNPCNCKADGSVANDGEHCCFDQKPIPNNPIADLNQCPNRVENINWQYQYDGCTLSPDNPAGGYYTAFHNDEHTGACDVHDECYQTCWTGDLEAARLACDKKLRDVARATCLNELIISPVNTAACLAYAEAYYQFLRLLFGEPAFKNRQKEVCNCCK